MKKMLKSAAVLAVFVAIFVLCALVLPNSACAATVDDLTYEITNGEVTITDCKTSASGELIIPDTIEGYPVTSIGDHAFSYCTGLTSVTIPDSVISIGDHAFDGCSNLTYNELDYGKYLGNAENPYYALLDTTSSNITSFYFSETTKIISNYAFNGCSSLTSVTIPDSVTRIGDRAFNCCSRLTSVTIGNSVTSIGEGAFSYCDSLQYNIYDNGEYLGNIDNPYLVLIKSVSRSVTNCVIHSETKVISAGTFDRCDSLTSITIPDSVSSIGESAFHGCSSLTSLTIGDSVVSIGDSAFRGCSSLTSVTIGNSVSSIGSSAFSGCSRLANVYISDVAAWCNILFSDQFSTPMECADNLYLNGELLTEVVIPEGVTSIRNYTFYRCTNLTSVTIPGSVTSIGYCAFYDCDSLTSVTIGDGVTSIGNYAFSWCGHLTSVTIPDSVTSIGKCIFYHCPFLSGIWVNENNIYYSSDNVGVLFNKEKTTIIQAPGAISGSYMIPDSVTSIGDNAFYSCNRLNSVTIGDNVTSIGYEAFSHCSSLTSVIIPDSATSIIGNSAFSGCYSLTSVTIGDGVTSIGSRAFGNCCSLTSSTIPDSVTSIGEYAFSGCYSLTSVTIGDGVTSVGSRAFSDCTSLTGIWVNENNTYYSNDNIGVLFNKEKTTIIQAPGAISGSYMIPDSVTSIGDYAFYVCDRLNSVIIPDNVTSIGSEAFSHCSSLTSVAIPDNVTNIGKQAFFRCKSLISVIVGNSVTSVGAEAFWQCDSLAGVYITDLAAWCNIDFSGLYSTPLCNDANLYLKEELLTELAIPHSVTSIGNYTFAWCDSLTSVTIPDSVTNIGDSAFYNCTSLTDVYITEIAAWCSVSFSNAKSNPMYYADNLCLNGEFLTELIIPNCVTSIGDYAFYNCSNLTSVTIPDSVTNIGDETFCSCSSLTNVYYPGTQKQWDSISIGWSNYSLTNASIHYNHTHDYSAVEPVVVVATCTDAGYTVYTCIHGETHRENFPCLGHSFMDYISDGNATCTADGTETAKCDRCEETNIRTVEGSALGHSFMDYVSDGNATCTEDGTETAKCERCEETDTRTVEGSALGHSFTDYISDENATCTADGTETAQCDHCEETDTRTEEESALGHSFTDYVSNGDATCTEDGAETAKCDRCDETDTRAEENSTLGHSFTDYVSDGNATCTKNGTETAKCDRCEETDTRTEVESAKGHSYGKWHVVTAATTNTVGEQRRDCTRCDAFETAVIPKLPAVKTQPANANLPAGKTAKFTVKATGEGLKYQWQYRTSSKGSWKNTTSTGYKTATLSVSATAARNGYQYRCKITDKYGRIVYSNAATLKVVTLKVTTQPANKYLPAGKTAKFTVKASGTGLKYQWQYRTSAKGSWKTASGTGSKKATLSVSATAARNGYQYRCKITDKYGNVIYSNAATLKIVTLKIITQPSSVTLAKGKTATFKVVAKGTGLKYQWQYRKNAKGAWKKTTDTGNKTATLKVPVTAARNGYQYRCVITDKYGNVINSKVATLKVK